MLIGFIRGEQFGYEKIKKAFLFWNMSLDLKVSLTIVKETGVKNKGEII